MVNIFNNFISLAFQRKSDTTQVLNDESIKQSNFLLYKNSYEKQHMRSWKTNIKLGKFSLMSMTAKGNLIYEELLHIP